MWDETMRVPRICCRRLGSSVLAPGKRPPLLKEVVQKGEKGFALVFEHYALVREGSLVGARIQPPSGGTAVQSPPSSGTADLLSPVTGQVSYFTVL
jgi:hypothetical protein